MSSRSTQIVGGPNREHAHVEAATNALRVHLVNGSGSGGGTEYAEDSPHTTGDLGKMVLVVRHDSGGSLVSADGDYAPLQVDSTGALRVTGGGGGVQHAEDAPHASGALGNLSLAVRNDTPGTLAGTDGDYAVFQVDAAGRLRVAVDSSVTVNVADGGGSLTIDGTVAATQSGTWNIGTVTAVTSITNVVSVNDNGGSLTVDGSVTATQTTHDSLNLNANVQQGDADVAALNALYVQPGTGASFPVTDNGGSLTVDGSVAATQSGTWNIASVTNPVTVVQTTHDSLNLNANVQQGDADVSTSNALFVRPGSGAQFDVTQGTSPWVVGDGGGSLTIDGSVRLQDGSGSDLLSVLGIYDTLTFPMVDNGIVPLFEVTDAPEPPANNVWSMGKMSPTNGGIYVSVQNAVSVLQSGSWTVGATQSGAWSVGQSGSWSVSVTSLIPGTGATNLGKAEDAVHASGDTGVMALAVRNDAGTTLVNATGDYAPLQVDSSGALRVVAAQTGAWSVTQSTHANLLGQNRIQDGDGANLLDVVRHGDTSPSYAGIDTRGLAPLAWNASISEAVPTADAWNPLLINSAGRLLVAAVAESVSSVVPGTASTNLGKAEDAVHASGDTGVMALAVRRDAASSGTSANGDYATLNVDSSGRLWVRNDNFTTRVLSGSTRGRPIQITGTGSGGAVTLHTATTTTGELDRVYVDLTNTSSAEVVVTIEYGTTGTANEVKVTVPPSSTVPAIQGMVLGGAATDTVRAYAGTANVINAIGRVERIPA